MIKTSLTIILLIHFSMFFGCRECKQNQQYVSIPKHDSMPGWGHYRIGKNPNEKNKKVESFYNERQKIETDGGGESFWGFIDSNGHFVLLNDNDSGNYVLQIDGGYYREMEKIHSNGHVIFINDSIDEREITGYFDSTFLGNQTHLYSPYEVLYTYPAQYKAKCVYCGKDTTYIGKYDLQPIIKGDSILGNWDSTKKFPITQEILF